MTASQPGTFVTVDGMGGAGKTTTALLVGDRLHAMGHTVHMATQPTWTVLGDLARHNTHVYSGFALACLVAADRYHHLETEVRPRLARGEIVICDRYIASSYVLQCMDGVPYEFIDCLNNHADPPDLAIVLTATPQVAADRIAARGSHGRSEAGIGTSTAEAELYGAVRSHLDKRGVPVVTIDTTNGSPEQVATRIAENVTRLGHAPDE